MATNLIHQMPSVRHNCHNHRRFLPHFPPGSMRCEFSPELVPPLPHAMMKVFPRSDSDLTYGSPPSPLSPLTPTGLPQQLIPKPPGEVSRVGRGGYKLKDLLEGRHGWKDGLYDKIRVLITRRHTSIRHTQDLSQERVRSMADNYLDTSLAFTAQERVKVDRICQLVRYFSYHVDMQLITPVVRGVPHPPQI